MTREPDRSCARNLRLAGVPMAVLILVAAMFPAPRGEADSRAERDHLVGYDLETRDHVENQLRSGREIFRFDTFGNEAFWGGELRLHEGVAQVSPNTALAVGLKVDSEALPPELIDDILNGKVDLDDPAVTLDLLGLDSVVGVTGIFGESGELTSIGIQCALCHSTVDDSILPGIGLRRDGWANRDLDVGAVVNLAPDLAAFEELLGVDEETVRTVLTSWGPGKFDASLSLDGKAFREDGGPAAVLIPPAFGLSGVNLHTWTGWGSVTHWNALVAVLEMHGQGTFIDPRLDDALRFPVAAANGFGNVRPEIDLVSGKLSALNFYQLALPAPKPPEGSFDPDAAARGEALFNGRGDCARCHVPPLYTGPAGTCTARRSSGSTRFRLSERRTRATERRRSPASGLTRPAASTTTVDSRLSTTSWATTTSYSTSVSPPRRRAISSSSSDPCRTPPTHHRWTAGGLDRDPSRPPAPRRPGCR